MDAKHTPGPWVVAHSFRGIYSQHPAPGPVQVCRAPENFHDQWDANAPLLAAAPDMLQMLRIVERYFDTEVPHPILQADINEVIAKATGATP